MSHILVVEDNAPLQHAYKTILDKAGHEVAVAADGEAALQMFKNKEYDLILLDMLMPRLDGLGFLEAFRKNGNKRTKIIAFSNMDDDCTVHEARRLKVDDYLIKASTSPSQVLYHVEHALNDK